LAISLAGTLFFKVPADQARGQVSLFLGLTMLPFAIVAPLIGPFLDRFSHGRRWAIGATMAIRAFLAWVLAGAVVHQSAMLFPAALGCLVASKAYNVTRAAAPPWPHRWPV
jgi:MFS family permease